ncbi:MAG: extracellular solute-binding protein [Chloroflexota bacterium]
MKDTAHWQRGGARVGARGMTGSVPEVSRRAVLAGAGAAVGSLLAACSIGGREGGSTSPPQQVSGTVVHWSIARFSFLEDIGADFAGEFRAKYPSIEYVPEVVVGNRFEKLLTAAAAGSAPDVGMSGSYQVQELAASGIARPVDEYLKQSRVVKQSDLWPALVSDMTYKGKQYGMPFGPDVRVMYANTDVLQSAGINPQRPAQSWDELEDHVKRLYRAGDQPRMGWGPFWGSGGRNLWLVAFWQLGGESLNKDGDQVIIDNEKGLEALEWLKRIHDLQGGWQATEEARMRGNTNQQFVNGNTGYYFATFTERKAKQFTDVPALKFGFTPWPLPRNGRRANYGGCHTFCITTQSKAPDAAWKLLEHLADEPNNLRFAVRFDRIPIRIKTAESQAYQQGDPFLKLAVEEMKYRRFVIPAPGGSEITGLTSAFIADVMSGKQSIRAGLADTSAQIQQVLDKWKR